MKGYVLNKGWCSCRINFTFHYGPLWQPVWLSPSCWFVPHVYHWLPASSVIPLPPRVEQSTSIPTTLYEFPNGYNINLTIEKFKLCEGLFDASTSNLKVCVQSCTLYAVICFHFQYTVNVKTMFIIYLNRSGVMSNQTGKCKNKGLLKCAFVLLLATVVLSPDHS